jgi:hypothetical protein
VPPRLSPTVCPPHHAPQGGVRGHRAKQLIQTKVDEAMSKKGGGRGKGGKGGRGGKGKGGGRGVRKN